MLVLMLVMGGLAGLFFFSSWIYMYMIFFFCLLFVIFYMNFELLNIHLFYNNLAGDGMSMGLVLLTFWILILMIYASLKEFSSSSGMSYLFLKGVMGGFLTLMFLSLDFFIFYLSFEIVLLPIFFIVLGWGYQPERLQAGVYLIFYTLFGSLPLLVMILYLMSVSGDFKMMGMDYSMPEGMLSLIFYLMGIFAFLVKMPMFMIHLWLPKAHVEASIAGSMILAGILLKMGGYGILRLSGVYFSVIPWISMILVSISLIGGILLSMLCLRQSDMKALIAYSSVVHMGMVIAGSMMMSSFGVIGAYILMIGHGLCSSGMFCLANLNYERTGSRSLIMNKGFINMVPVASLMWFLMCSSNMSAPPSLNLMGELMLIISLVVWSFYILILLVFFSFFSSTYSLYLFCSTQHGQMIQLNYSYKEYSMMEYLLLMMHWWPLNLLFLKGDLFIL